MVRFGRYETDKPLSWNESKTVYLAHVAEGADDREYVVEVDRPPPREDESRPGTESKPGFLESAQIQKSMAAAAPQHSQYWAPVHECGVTENGAYYATDRYACCLKDLVQRPEKIRAADLRHLIESIVHGLLAMERVCHRPHGNLKATNVLLTGEHEVSKARVVLCDPLWAGGFRTQAPAHNDLKQVAILIYQLVTKSGITELREIRLQDAEPWGRLGKHGDCWRDLCKRLIGKEPQPSPLTLEGLAEELQQLPRRRKWPRKAFYAVVGPVAALLILLVLWLARPPLHMRIWNEFVDSTPWMARLREMSESEKRAEAELGEVWSDLEQLKRQCETAGYAASDWARWLREQQRGKLPFSKDEWKKHALCVRACLRDIEGRLFKSSDPNYWPIGFVTRSEEIGNRGWKGGAKYLTELRKLITRDDPCLVDHMKQVRDAWHLLEPIQLDQLDTKAVEKDFTEEPTSRTIEDQLKLLGQYYPAEDCRAYQADVERAYEKAMADAKGTDYDKELDALKEKKRIFDANHPCVQRHKRDIQDFYKAHLGKILEIEERIAAALDKRDDWWKGMDRNLDFTSRHIQDAWRSWRDRCMKKSDKDYYATRACTFDEFLKFATNADKIRSSLIDLDKNLRFTPASDLGTWSEFCRGEVESRREDFLVKDLPLDKDPDPAMFPGLVSRFQAVAGELAHLARDFAAIEKALDEWYLLNDKLADGRDIETVHGSWAGSTIWKDVRTPQPNSPIGTIANRIKTLQAIAEPNRTAEDLADLNKYSQDAAAVYAAWVRRGGITTDGDAWPHSPEARKQDREIQQWLLARLQGRDGKRWSDLRQRVLQGSLQRDRTFLLTYGCRGDGKVLQETLEGLFKRLPEEVGEEDVDTVAKIAELVAGLDWPKDFDLSNLDTSMKTVDDLYGQLKHAQTPEICHYLARTRDKKGGYYVTFAESLLLPPPQPNTDRKMSSYFVPVTKVNDRFEPITVGSLTVLADLKSPVDVFDEAARQRGSMNFGWPKYLQSTSPGDDPVVLRFVPSESSGEEPFYIGISEITNGQYSRFLDRSKPDYGRCIGELDSVTYDALHDALKEDTSKGSPIPIPKDSEEKKSVPIDFPKRPVVWVTYEGARQFAEALHAQLPEEAWHARASRWNDSRGPYNVPGRYHVRSREWAKEVRRYKPKPPGLFSRDQLAPFGVDSNNVKIVGYPQTIDDIREEDYVSAPGSGSIWPRPHKPKDGFEVHDLIGNVWEWCTVEKNKHVLCGGSCLSDLEYAQPGSELRPRTETANAWCDVGFRVALSLPRPQ